MQRVDGNRVYFSSARETPESRCRSELSRRFWLFEAAALFIYLTGSYSQGAARCGFGQKGMSREEPFERVVGIDCYLGELRTIPLALTMAGVS